MRKEWVPVKSVMVANGIAREGSAVAVAVGEGRYGGGLRMGYVEAVEAHAYVATHLREWAAPDDSRPTIQMWNGDEIAPRASDGWRMVAKPDETRHRYRVLVRVKNDSGRSKDYSKRYEYPQRIAVVKSIVATEIDE